MTIAIIDSGIFEESRTRASTVNSIVYSLPDSLVCYNELHAEMNSKIQDRAHSRLNADLLDRISEKCTLGSLFRERPKHDDLFCCCTVP